MEEKEHSIGKWEEQGDIRLTRKNWETYNLVWEYANRFIKINLVAESRVNQFKKSIRSQEFGNVIKLEELLLNQTWIWRKNQKSLKWFRID